MDDGRIGASIRLLRYRRGWRQVDLAAQSAVSQSAISDIERGRLDRYTITARRRIGQYEAQFRSLDIRGIAARAFIHHPSAVDGSGILAFVTLSPTNQGRLSLAGRRRIRRRPSLDGAKPMVVGT